jgi:hypothetical protein
LRQAGLKHEHNENQVLAKAVIVKEFFGACIGIVITNQWDTQSAELNRQKIGGEFPLLSKG